MRHKDKPFEGKRFAVTRGFSAEHGKTKMMHATNLITTLGKGKMVGTQREADYILVSNKEFKGSKGTITWSSLIKMALPD